MSQGNNLKHRPSRILAIQNANPRKDNLDCGTVAAIPRARAMRRRCGRLSISGERTRPRSVPAAISGVSPESRVRRDAEHHTRDAAGRVCSPDTSVASVTRVRRRPSTVSQSNAIVGSSANGAASTCGSLSARARPHCAAGLPLNHHLSTLNSSGAATCPWLRSRRPRRSPDR